MSKKAKSLEHQYSAKNIEALEPLEHIRRRPAMYFGGRGKRALHHTIDEVIDFVLPNVFENQCDSIEIRLQPDHYVMIVDNDVSFPRELAEDDYLKTWKYLRLDAIFTMSGQRPGARSYEYSVDGGLHGLGIISINAVSSFMSIIVKHDKTIMKRTFRKGQSHGAYQKYQVDAPQSSGVSITFQPDFTIFEKHDFDYEWLANRCREIALTQPHLTMTLIDERTSDVRQDVFHYPDGIQTLVRDLNHNKTPIHDILYIHHTIPLKTYNGEQGIHVEIALQFTESDEMDVRGYVNTVYSEQGGTHVDGFQHTLIGYLTAGYDEPQEWNKTAPGLPAVIHLLFPDYHAL